MKDVDKSVKINKIEKINSEKSNEIVKNKVKVHK